MVILLTRELIGTVLVSLVFLVAIFIFFRVKQRRNAQEQALPMPLAGTSGQKLLSCLYVASVFGSRPLERVWAHGLGIRGKAEIHRTSKGLSIQRQGRVALPFRFRRLLVWIAPGQQSIEV